MESSQIRHPDNLALLSSLSSEMSSMTILWSCGDDDGGDDDGGGGDDGDDDGGDDDGGDDDGGDGDGELEGAASTTLGKFALQ